jgi:hypothetical protein
MAQSYSNGGGSGNRIGGIDLTLAGSFHLGSGITTEVQYELLDGLTTFPTNTWFNGGTGYSFIHDFHEARVIDEARFRQSDASTHGTWVWRGSNNGSSWTDIGPSTGFTLGGSTAQLHTSMNGNTTAYRYYGLFQLSGSASSSPYLIEIEFQIDTPPALSYFNTGGQGDRSAGIPTVTTTATLSGGGASVMTPTVDGSVKQNTTNAVYFNAGQTLRDIKFDFGVGVRKRITELKAIWSGTTAQGGTWEITGSDDYANFSTVYYSGSFGGAVRQAISLSGNAYGYRYYRIRQTSGSTTNTDNLEEFAFQIGTGSADPGLGVGGGGRRRSGMMF